MSDTNLVVQKGRLVRNAELKYTNNGTACTSFSIAVNESVKKGDSWENRPNYFDVTMWGNYGKAVIQYLTKGREVLVSGRLRQDRWESDNGTKNAKIQIIADNLEILREPKNNGNQPQKGNAANSNNAPADYVPEEYSDAPEGDSPFN